MESLLLFFCLFVLLIILSNLKVIENFQNKTRSRFGLYSNSLYNDGKIPDKYTCSNGGSNMLFSGVSPDFYWRYPPANTVSLALIMEDITNQENKKTHWLIWNLYPNGELTEGDKSKLMGTNDFGTIGYKDPCKIMTQTKKFQITLYALDILSIPLLNSKTKKKDLLSAMNTHIIEKTEMSVYL